MAARTIKALMARRAALLAEIAAVEAEAKERFPKRVPACASCGCAFGETNGWHARCCGAC